MSECHILILEDEPIIEEFLLRSLEETTLNKIHFVDSVLKAQDMIDKTPPSNILLNLKLADGWLTKNEVDFFLLDHRWQTVLVTGARLCDILKDTSIKALNEIKILAKPFNSYQLLRTVNGLIPN